MKDNFTRYFVSLFVIIFIIWTISCSGRPEKNGGSGVNSTPASSAEVAVKLIKMISPEENTAFKLRDQVKVVLAAGGRNNIPDSVMINFNGNHVTTIKSEPWEFSIPSSYTVTTGRKSIKATAYKAGKALTTVTRFMIIYSDIVPKTSGYKVVKTYPHNRDAFTQGLVYDNGVLYEGTGQETGSSLREVDLETGKIRRQLNLDASLFGEGIALYRDRIFQVTWRNKVGFIYEKQTFKVLNKTYYSTEGWGLTTMNDKIVMSDGTNILYFYEPEMFTVTSQIEVYDNEKKIDSLNELEYIDGEIWANIWMSDLIARIDPVSGKVLSYINLKGILPEEDKQFDTDVLNGIAYDKAGKRIFITGKRWPKLFEIRPVE